MRTFCVAGIVCASMLLGACSRTSNDNSTTGAVAASSPSNSVAVPNVETVNANLGPSARDSANRTELGNRGRLPQKGVTSASPAPMDFRPGPENSQTATTMNENGQPVEVRIFNDNEQLSRVEATWLGANQKLLKITLRNGQTVEVKTDRIENLSTAPSGLIVELAGGSK